MSVPRDPAYERLVEDLASYPPDARKMIADAADLRWRMRHPEATEQAAVDAIRDLLYDEPRAIDIIRDLLDNEPAAPRAVPVDDMTWSPAQRNLLQWIVDQGGWYASWKGAPTAATRKSVEHMTGVRFHREEVRDDGIWYSPFQDEDRRHLLDLAASLGITRTDGGATL